MKKIVLFSILLLTATLWSCARYEIYPVAANSQAEGLRFYASDAYVFVTFNDSTYEAQIKFLPDRAREYRIARRGFIGKADLNATIEDGWNLKELGTTNDPQISEAVTSVLSSVIPALLPAALAESEKNNPTGDPACKVPCMFRLVHDSGGYRLIQILE